MPASPSWFMPSWTRSATTARPAASPMPAAGAVRGGHGSWHVRFHELCPCRRTGGEQAVEHMARGVQDGDVAGSVGGLVRRATAEPRRHADGARVIGRDGVEPAVREHRRHPQDRRGVVRGRRHRLVDDRDDRRDDHLHGRVAGAQVEADSTRTRRALLDRRRRRPSANPATRRPATSLPARSGTYGGPSSLLRPDVGRRGDRRCEPSPVLGMVSTTVRTRPAPG